MSLKNVIRYYDGNGTEMFAEPCNFAWFFTPQDLARVIWDSANNHPDVYVSCNSIKLYDYTFSRSVLDLAKNIEQLTKIVEMCMNTDDKLEDFVNAEEYVIAKFFEDIELNNEISSLKFPEHIKKM